MSSLVPRGNQSKRFEGGTFIKVDYFGGEAVSEFLVSLFLESTSFKDFVPYRYVFPSICKSPSYKPRYTFVSMFQIVLDYFYYKEPAYVESLLQQRSKRSSESRRYFVFECWVNKRYLKLPIKDRVTELQRMMFWYSDGSVTYEDSASYFSAFVTLDTIFINIDRHFQNFGLMFDSETNSYRTSLLFDQGFSLGVGGDIQSLQKIHKFKSKKVKMQPFGTTLTSNAKAVGWYLFDFDVVKFVSLVDETVKNSSLLKNFDQWLLMKIRLGHYFPVDCNGISTLEYLNSHDL